MIKTSKIRFQCPCGGMVYWKKERVVQEGIDCGVMDVEICDKCCAKYLPDESMVIVEEKLKEHGLWGVERKELKFWKTGNSITLRLPVALVRKLGLHRVKKGYIYQEGEHKLTIEF